MIPTKMFKSSPSYLIIFRIHNPRNIFRSKKKRLCLFYQFKKLYKEPVSYIIYIPMPHITKSLTRRPPNKPIKLSMWNF